MKKLFGLLLAAGVIAANYSAPMRIFRKIPSTLNVQQGQRLELKTGFPTGWLTVDNVGDLDLGLSHTALTGESVLGGGVEIDPQQCGQTVVSLSLFGLIPVKTVNVQVMPEMMVVPGGYSIGVSILTRGLLVVSISDLNDGQRVSRPAEEGGLQSGDLITEANGMALTDAASLAAMVEQCNGQPISLVVEREGARRQMTVHPVQDLSDHVYRLGIWVRDSSAGVGTLTYYNPANGDYGALGHAIRDLDTGSLLEVREGIIQRSEIIDVQEGVRGVPGELRGIFYTGGEQLGVIRANTDMGLFGSLTATLEDNPYYPDPVPIASHTEVVEGPATLLATVDGNGICAYDCRIIRIFKQDQPAAKSMIIQVTDPDLLAKTGGIVQGMSGSPILQNGKLVGAVTHVFINDPTQGHAIFAEWMIISSQSAG